MLHSVKSVLCFGSARWLYWIPHTKWRKTKVNGKTHFFFSALDVLPCTLAFILRWFKRNRKIKTTETIVVVGFYFYIVYIIFDVCKWRFGLVLWSWCVLFCFQHITFSRLLLRKIVYYVLNAKVKVSNERNKRKKKITEKNMPVCLFINVCNSKS